MKIYFSGSIRGGREHIEWYNFIIRELSLYGEVLTEFVADKSLSSYGTLNMTDKEIYDRDISLIKEAEIIVADVTIPSLGVGYEIAFAEKLNKNIFCLYHKTDDKKVSAMISGDSNLNFFNYQSKEDISEIMKSIFK